MVTINKKSCITALAALCCCLQPVSAQADTLRREFFDSLEIQLLADYRLCTSDSSARPLDFLLKWKKSIDIFSESDNYPSIVKKFTAETGMRPADARPCEIYRWFNMTASELRESSRLLDDQRTRDIQEYNDSVNLVHELAGSIRAPYDIKSIPFGLSARAFSSMAKRNGLPPLALEENIFRCDNFPVGVQSFKAAFHFNRDGRYWCYEFESETFGFDSLNTGARQMMDFLSAQMEMKTEKSPDHIYRVGQFDIVPGRLAICRLWNFDNAMVYVGLARAANRFYAKTIVQSKQAVK